MLFFQNIHIGGRKSGVKKINQKQPFGTASHAEELSAGTRDTVWVYKDLINRYLQEFLQAGRADATERHVASSPSSLCLRSFGPPKLSCYRYFLVLVLQAPTRVPGGPYGPYNVTPLRATWLERCCKPAAQGCVSQAELES